MSIRFSKWYPMNPDYPIGTKLLHYTFTKDSFDKLGTKGVKKVLDENGCSNPCFTRNIIIDNKVSHIDFVWLDSASQRRIATER